MITLVIIWSINILRINFWEPTLLGSNWTTDAAIEEQEEIYVTSLNPDNFEPHHAFLTIADINESQDAPGFKKALFKSFEDHNIEGILKKLFFLHQTEHQ